MRSFKVPNNSSSADALRQLKLALKELDVPLLTKKSSLNGIMNGTSAYIFEGKNLCRYTKMHGKLYRECIDTQDTPPTTTAGESEVFYSSTFGET